MSAVTSKEQAKLDVIRKALSGQLTNGQASQMLAVSIRQIQRLKKDVREQGERAVVHKLKWRMGNHRINTEVKKEALRIVRDKYSDFKPGFATEKLKEFHGITVSDETLRLWMIQEELWKPRKQKKVVYRSWRPRKEYFGELQQFDGSYHLWFEDRYCDEDGNPLEVCLLASIDDATGQITKAMFAQNEGIVAVFQFWKEYIEETGKPCSIYLDKFSTYKINHKVALDNHELMTQFERAMQNISVLLITAHSPEAKGRIERLFGTLQDRLVKEMRLAEINTPEEGNRFLKKTFIPRFNSKFSVLPAKEGDVHRPLSEVDIQNIHRIFSVQSKRRVNNDFTIQFKNKWYQLAEIQPTTVRARESILVEEWLDATVHFNLRGKYLAYTILSQKPEKAKANPLIITTHPLNWVPPENHPWRKSYKPRG